MIKKTDQILMRVYIKLLANYRRLLPPGTSGDQISILVPEGSYTESILNMFNIPPIPESVILINGMTLNPEQPLQEDDVICAFPAIAGGRKYEPGEKNECLAWKNFTGKFIDKIHSY